MYNVIVINVIVPVVPCLRTVEEYSHNSVIMLHGTCSRPALKFACKHDACPTVGPMKYD